MMVLWKARGGLNPLEGFLSVDHSPGMVPWWFPPTQPKGLNPLEGFLSVGHSPCMVPWWFPPFLSVDHFPCNVCLWWGSISDASAPMGKRKPTRPRRRKVFLVLEVSQCLVLGVSSWCWLGVSRCWKWVDFWSWKWVVNRFSECSAFVFSLIQDPGITCFCHPPVDSHRFS